jgi:hypothetical protein
MLASCGLWFEALFQEQTLVIGGIVEPGKFVVTEPAIEIRRLERKGVEPGGMAAEIATVALGLRPAGRVCFRSAPMPYLFRSRQFCRAPYGI